MPIKIRRGTAGDASPLIMFTGFTTSDQSAANISNMVSRVQPRINPSDPDLIDVLDILATENNGYDTFELDSIHYTEWLDRDDNPFQNAGDVVGYIDGERFSYIGAISQRRATPLVFPLQITINSGDSFELKVSNITYGSIFWDESTFTSGVEVSPYDRRIIRGTINTPGTYNFAYDATNMNGITSATATVNVL